LAGGLLKGSDKEAPKVLGDMEGTMMDILFRGIDESSPCVLNELLEIDPETAMEAVNKVYGIEVLESSSYSDMCNRCSTLPPLDADEAQGVIKVAMGSARAWVQLGR
jgi:hypothetical protein